MDGELERWKSAGRYFDYLGFEIFHRVDGAPLGEAPTLLLVHGYPFNSWDWSLIWAALTERFTVIALVSTGNPASIDDVRATFIPCDASGNAQPMITSSISDASTPARDTASFIAVAPSSSERVFHNVPAGALLAVYQSRCQPGFRRQCDFFHVSTVVKIGGIHHGADLHQRVNFRRRVPFI